MLKKHTQKGITLIALIITIVVLLILAVVAINAVTGDGIIQHATNAKTSYEKAQDNEVEVLSHYQEYLYAQGNLGPWVQEKTRVINSKTGEELEVGDIVEYKKDANTKYKDSNNNEITWAVLGVENGKVLLVSTTNVATIELSGANDYIDNAGIINKLNPEGAKYADGIGAVKGSGRSINVDDINRVTGYNPLKTGTGEPYYAYTWTNKTEEVKRVTQYLNKVTYAINEDGKVTYSSDLSSGVSPYDAQYQKFMRVEDGTELAQGESITVESNFYGYYPVSLSLDSDPKGEVKGISADSNAYTLLFADTDIDTGKAYWLGSSFVLALDGYVTFGVRLVYSGYVGGYSLWGSYDGAVSASRGVRAVVSLKSNVQFTKTADNTYTVSDAK